MNHNIKLFSPGPAPIASIPLSVLSAPPLHHRSVEFSAILKETLELLKVFFDEEYLVIFPSTGSGGLEASVVNFLKKDDFVISLDGGKFGQRWSKLLHAYSIDHEVYKFPWGETPSPTHVRVLLKKHKPKAFFMQACETSTGTCFNVGEIAKLIKAHSPQTLLIVDGITAVGSYELSMKENSIDVLINGSQKALGLPTGLSFVGFSKKAKDLAHESNLPKFYFNILNELKALLKGTTVFSSPTQVWRALHLQLQSIKNTGLSLKYMNSLSLQKIILNWVLKNHEGLKIKIFSKNPSPSLTAILLPDTLSASKIQKALLQQGYYIATGQDHYSDKLLRIGHMANLKESDMYDFLVVLEKTLKDQSH